MVEDSTKKDKSDQEVPIEEDAPGPPKLKKRKTKKKETDNSKKIKSKYCLANTMILFTIINYIVCFDCFCS